jgi:hypothetical protein
LIKTYDTLCESCRSIAPLQLLVLETFHLVDNYGSYAFFRGVKDLKTGSSDVHTAPERECAPTPSCHALSRASTGVRRSWKCRCGPARRRGPSASPSPCAPCPHKPRAPSRPHAARQVAAPQAHAHTSYMT